MVRPALAQPRATAHQPGDLLEFNCLSPFQNRVAGRRADAVGWSAAVSVVELFSPPTKEIPTTIPMGIIN